MTTKQIVLIVALMSGGYYVMGTQIVFVCLAAFTSFYVSMIFWADETVAWVIGVVVFVVVFLLRHPDKSTSSGQSSSGGRYGTH